MLGKIVAVVLIYNTIPLIFLVMLTLIVMWFVDNNKGGPRPA